MNWGLPIWAGIGLTLLVAVGIGTYHGLYVTKLHMHGFLITLVTFGLARGFILVLTNAFPITGLPPAYNFLRTRLSVWRRPSAGFDLPYHRRGRPTISVI